MTPAVSVCIPVYNGGPFIGMAIESVLSQSFTDFELVVLDNCSTDDTVAVVERFDDRRLHLIRNPRNLGAEANWNLALDSATGEFVKIVCADDLLLPACLERQVAQLRAHAADGVVLCCGRRKIIDQSGNVRLPRWGTSGLPVGIVPGAEAIRAIARSGTNPIGESCAVLFARRTLASAGRFSARLPYMIDVDFWVRVVQQGNVFVDREAVCAFRVWGGSWSGELVGKQSSQARTFVRQLAAQYPGIVTRADRLSGLARATALAPLRQLFYAYLALRSRRA